tara:strand:- start:2252 stop:2905 length:654 start_codon:yes stop_codon:yes gene_type:complete
LGDIFQEVDEELRKDKFEKLWKHYGRYSVGFALICVISVGVWQGWKSYSEAQRLSSSKQYEAALNFHASGKNKDALIVLDGLGKSGFGSYKLLASFKKAAILGNSGDIEGALETYEKLIENSKNHELFRQAAVLFSVRYKLKLPSVDVKTLIKDLKPIRKSDGVWKFSADETVGILLMSAGKISEARKIFQDLAENLKAPSRLRGRATQVLTAIGQQ